MDYILKTYNQFNVKNLSKYKLYDHNCSYYKLNDNSTIIFLKNYDSIYMSYELDNLNNLIKTKINILYLEKYPDDGHNNIQIALNKLNNIKYIVYNNVMLKHNNNEYGWKLVNEK